MARKQYPIKEALNIIFSARRPIALFLSLAATFIAGFGMTIYALREVSITILALVATFFITALCICFGVIAWLIAKHPRNMYSPADYDSPDDFLRAVGNAASSIERIGRKPGSNIFEPLHLQQPLAAGDIELVTERSDHFVKVLDGFDANDFSILHSWFNARERHDLALVAINIAIAKGAATSKHFSFRAASLRKLGRHLESLHSAQLALELDPDNIDALYNLARIQLAIGHREEFSLVYERLIEMPEATEYVKRLKAANLTERSNASKHLR